MKRMRLRRCAAVCLQPFSSTDTNFAIKNVEYEQKHFQGVVLPQALCAEKERNDSRDVPYHGERKGITVQQQAGRVQTAQRGLCEAGGEDEKRAQLLEILRGI